MPNYKNNNEPTTLTCIHCHYTWEYKGRNLTNVCCPNCKIRSNHTKGKSLLMNNFSTKLQELEQRIEHLESLFNNDQS